MEIERLLADRTEKMGVNAIREILKVVSQPGMVSLAGGIPAPESFPLDIIRELTSIVFEKYSSRALQYDPTEGFYPLREALVDYLQKKMFMPKPMKYSSRVDPREYWMRSVWF
jgi:2-aminoadipate transaminase